VFFDQWAGFLDNARRTGVDFRRMNFTLVIKASRLLLALCVSVWMAGGCLFGCSGSDVSAAEISNDANDSSVVVSDESCNMSRQHDCCTRPNAQKPKAKTRRQVARSQPIDNSALTGLPHGMQDCPLMTNGTAVTVKSSGNLPDPGGASVAVLPAIKNTSEQIQFTPVRSYLPNRGPTHLRCCVFLI
jgi:hypothetical protein